MPLSKAAMRARKRTDRAKARGVKPSQADVFDSLPQYKRKERLAEIAMTPLDKVPIKGGHIIMAIKELNLMEHVYDPDYSKAQGNRQYNIIIQGKDAEERFNQLLAGKLPQLEAPQDVVEGEVV